MEFVVSDLADADVDEADRIFRRAFGTFLQVPNPETAFGDTDMLRTRRRAPNTRVLAAHAEGRLVASNVVTRWGGLGWFGPLTVAPEYWDHGAARALLDRTAQVFDEWGVRMRALFTFSHSPKHLALYQRYGFWPQALTPIYTREIAPVPGTSSGEPARRFSTLSPSDQDHTRTGVRQLCSRLWNGLDVTGELESIQDQRLGDTLILGPAPGVDGFAACHSGPSTEAGSGTAYVKFAALAPGPARERRREALLDAVEHWAIERGATTVEIGVNLGNKEAARALIQRGYRSDFVGVAMCAPDEPGYHRPDLDVFDDWR